MKPSLFSGMLLALLLGLPCATAKAETLRTVQAEMDIRQLESAFESFRLHFFRYPTAEEGLKALVTPTEELRQSGKYPEDGFVLHLRRDPWGNDYQFRCPGTHNPGSCDIWTLGSDGRPGGEKHAKDRGNWPGSFESPEPEFSTGAIIFFPALVGFVLALPIFGAGWILKRRSGAKPLTAMRGFHLGALLYLVLVGPLLGLTLWSIAYLRS
jgi:general secretion pathway protein G